MPRRLTGILILLLVSVFGWAQGDVTLLRIGETPVPLSEFLRYQHQINVPDTEHALAEFVAYKTKVVYARELQLDTCTDFRMHLMHRKEKLARKASNPINTVSDKGGWVKLKVITRFIPQRNAAELMRQEKLRMDSIYVALKQGADFEKTAEQYGMHEVNQNLPVSFMLQEWQVALGSIGINEFSKPFLSPWGIHIVKLVERRNVRNDDTPPVSADMDIRMAEVEEKLLTDALMRSAFAPSEECTPQELETYFRTHRSRYNWDVPHYRGGVVHCRNKKEAKAIRKMLKRIPEDSWVVSFEKQYEQEKEDAPKMEYGLYAIGENVYIDKLVFKCGDYTPHPQLPVTIVVGKKMKKGPQTYRDVEEKIKKDFIQDRNDRWNMALKQKYGVEIDRSVLKSVNNDGTK